MLGLPSPDGLLASFSGGKSHRKWLTSGSASVGRQGVGTGPQGPAASKGDYKAVFRLPSTFLSESHDSEAPRVTMATSPVSLEVSSDTGCSGT